MAVGGRNKWTPSRKSGGSLRVVRFSLSVENEQAGAGRDGTAEPVSRNQSLRRKRKIFFPCQLTTARIGNYTRLTHARMKVLTINKYYVW